MRRLRLEVFDRLITDREPPVTTTVLLVIRCAAAAILRVGVPHGCYETEIQPLRAGTS